ncbi:hypothetical protein J5N97_009659 [Dioscorea zingiberensis]|uniref:Uncharacterized protein n=1 Tax=Dioscorea zingiberensis TaxID=325984 RepID=A0A9D5CYM9_9LILI|nr:hypothetical protein J5N97_009659 [Dioscorea zingiberensis]
MELRPSVASSQPPPDAPVRLSLSPARLRRRRAAQPLPLHAWQLSALCPCSTPRHGRPPLCSAPFPSHQQPAGAPPPFAPPPLPCRPNTTVRPRCPFVRLRPTLTCSPIFARCSGRIEDERP